MTLIEYHMKRIISFLLAMTIPALAACGSSKAAAEAAPTTITPPTVDSQPAESAQPRWSPPEETAEEPVQIPETSAQTEETEKQPFFHTGVPNKEILEILGKPDRSELGANSRHLYNNCEYNGILFKSIEIDITNDGTAFLVVLVADGSIDQEKIKTFMQDWADALQAENGAPGTTKMDDSLYLNYDWSKESLQLAMYPNDPDYHIGLVWKLF